LTLYNFSDLMAANSTLELLVGTTGLVSWYAIGAMVAVFFVIFLSFKSDDAPTLMMIAGFFTSVIGSFLWLAGFVPFIAIIFAILTTVVGFLVSWFTGGK